ncbi:uncharacterized protein LOC142814676 [Rhipicephalus microplus]|uniref:uncharacterized protein LOC142814676 n=1 Tax=Rhipicephalus microplus TaxID=6941 RepID=UPI003F6CB4B8
MVSQHSRCAASWLPTAYMQASRESRCWHSTRGCSYDGRRRHEDRRHGDRRQSLARPTSVPSPFNNKEPSDTQSHPEPQQDYVAPTTSEASEPESPTSESEIGGNCLHGKLQCQTHSTTGSRGTQRAIQGPSSDVATPTSEALQHQADECGEDQGDGFQMTRGNKRWCSCHVSVGAARKQHVGAARKQHINSFSTIAPTPPGHQSSFAGPIANDNLHSVAYKAATWICAALWLWLCHISTH